jgi:hypothetical protein
MCFLKSGSLQTGAPEKLTDFKFFKEKMASICRLNLNRLPLKFKFSKFEKSFVKLGSISSICLSDKSISLAFEGSIRCIQQI